MSFVQHPDGTFTGTERVGARLVEFEDGVARVDLPDLLGRHQRLGYVIDDGQGNDPLAPARSASTEEWRVFAHSRATSPEEHAEIDETSRDDLRDTYGAAGDLDG